MPQPPPPASAPRLPELVVASMAALVLVAAAASDLPGDPRLAAVLATAAVGTLGALWLAYRHRAAAEGRLSGVAIDVTGRQHADEMQSHLAAVVEGSDDAIITKDLSGVIRSANAAAERIFGYPRTELVGQPITILLPPERFAEEAAILARLKAGERIDHYETVRVAKDGRHVDVSLTISPIRDARGRIVGASKTARDITERKRAADELANQREWFRVTLSSIGDAVIACDVDGRVNFMNAAAATLTAWPAAEALGRPLEEVFHIVNEKTREHVADPVQRVLREGHVVGLANHTVLVARDGTERPIADSAAPIRAAGGAIIGAVLVFQDVSEARRAEEHLEEQREWFARTLESIGDGVIATDVHGEIVFMNPVAERLTGTTLQDALGRSCESVVKIVEEATGEPIPDPVQRVLSEGAPAALRERALLVAADGSGRAIDDSAAPIRSPTGRLLGAVLVLRDVSERRRTELELERGALERERLLDSERAARADAERANRVKDDFMATLSHELRTPLNAIHGWVQLLGHKSDPETLRRGLEVLDRNVRLQTQLISDLLDISRIVSGKLRLEMEPIDIGSIVEEAIQTVQGAADGKGVQIRRAIDVARPRVVGDAARLQQVLWNLLSNAVKFTSRGGTISVAVTNAGSHTDVTVADDGAGIRPELLPFVFDRFRQGDLASTRKLGGLGLGLAIVKELVQLHGGAVRAASEGEGKGARFTITLPVAAARVGLPPSPAAPRAWRAPAARSLRGISVLVVEDEPDARDIVTRLLEEHDAEVVATPSASEALDLVARERPDVIVSDIGLPGMDGYALIREIRNRPPLEGGRTPAVALTAFARVEDRARALRAGFQAHMAKPIEPSELIATVASLSGLAGGPAGGKR